MALLYVHRVKDIGLKSNKARASNSQDLPNMDILANFEYQDNPL